MALPGVKGANDFPFKHTGQPDALGQAEGGDFAAIQALFDSRATFNQTQINAIITALESVADGDSGADNVSATPVSGGVANTVQGVLEEIIAIDGNNVKLTGNQTVAGIKTFSSSPIVPTPTTSTQASTKGYVDGLDVKNVKIIGTQTIAGVKTFSSSPIVPTPTTSTQASTKGYVDTSISGVVLGQIPNDSLTESKMANEMKKIAGGVAPYDDVIFESIVTAANDFIVGTANATVAKKTLSETKTILGLEDIKDSNNGLTLKLPSTTDLIYTGGVLTSVDELVNSVLYRRTALTYTLGVLTSTNTKIYDSLGTTVISEVTDTLNYTSGVLESITRVVNI